MAAAILLEGLAKVCRELLSVSKEGRKSLISEELTFQNDLKGKLDKIEDFRKGIFGSSELHVFVWHKLGSPIYNWCIWLASSMSWGG